MRACPICHEGVLRRRHRVNGFDVLGCPECKVGLAWPLPSASELAEIYRDPRYFSGASYYLDYLRHEQNHRRLARRVLRVLGPPGALLDVGAAAGFFLDEARRAGWSPVGVEPSPEMSRHARDELGLDVTTGAFEPAGFGSRRFRAVTFLDSLEHFSDPEAALAGARELLEPGGVLAILTPNGESPLAKLMGARWPHYTPPEHVWYFSSASLRRVLARVGFELRREGSVGHYWSIEELSTKLAPALGRRLGPRLLGKNVYLNVGDLLVIATASENVHARAS